MGIVQRQSIQTAVLTYIGAALGYVNFILLYPTYMEPAQVGLVRVLIAVSVLLSQLSMLGSSLTLQRYFPYFKDAEKKHHGFLPFIFLICLGGFVVFGSITWMGREQVYRMFEARSPLFNSYYAFVYPLAFLLTVFEVLFFYARSLLLTVIPVFIREVFLRLLQTVVLLVFVIRDVPFELFLWLFVATYLLHFVFIVIYLLAQRQLHWWTGVNVNAIIPYRQLSRYGLFVYMASIASIYTQNIDTIMLSALVGLDETAVYSVAFFIGTLVIIPARAMNQVAIPLIADAWKRNDLPQLQTLYRQTANNQLIVGSFIVLMLLFNTRWLLDLLPTVYHQAEWAVYIIAGARLLDMAAGVNGEMILYSKHVRFNLATNLLLIVVSTVAVFWLIPRFGIIGAALSVPIAFLVYNGVRVVFLWSRYRMHPFIPIANAATLMLFGAIGAFALTLPEGYRTFGWSLFWSAGASLLFWGLVWRLKLSAEINGLIHKAFTGKIF